MPSDACHPLHAIRCVVSHAHAPRAARAPLPHPRPHPRAQVREHLAFGAPLLAELLQPSGGWPTARLDGQKLLCFGWDRTSDARDWPEGQPRFFRFERYRTQDLSRRPDLEARVPSDPGLVLTEAMKEQSLRLLDGYKHAQPVLLEGEAAGGKTAAVAFCAHRTNSPLTRFNMTPNTSIADFVGQLGLTSDDSFSFCLGPFAEAVKDGLWLLVDEANLAQDAVLRVMEGVLATGFVRLGTGGVAGQPGSTAGQLTIPAHPNFRLFLTQNSADDVKYGTTRHLLSASLLSHFVPVVSPPMEPQQMHHILASRLLRCTPDVRAPADAEEAEPRFDVGAWAYTCADALMGLYRATHEAAKAERLKQTATLRDLLQAADLIAAPLEDLRRHLAVVDGLKAIFTQRLRFHASIARVSRLVDRYENDFLPLGGGRLTGAAELFAGGRTGGGFGAPGGGGGATADRADTLTVLPEHRSMFGLLDVARATRKPVLLCGPDRSGKASAALAWARHNGCECVLRVLTPDCTAEDLFGKLVPNASAAEVRPPACPGTHAMRRHARHAPACMGCVASLVSAATPSPLPRPTVCCLTPSSDFRTAPQHEGGGGAPPFRWEPGPVTRAMEGGHVLLLRGIDAPEPAVLESLNAVLEVRAAAPTPPPSCLALASPRLRLPPHPLLAMPPLHRAMRRLFPPPTLALRPTGGRELQAHGARQRAHRAGLARILCSVHHACDAARSHAGPRLALPRHPMGRRRRPWV